MNSPLETNIGHAATGGANQALPYLEVLGQGCAIRYLTQQFARLRRQWKNDLAAEAHIHSLVNVADIVALGAVSDGRLNTDKVADLISFVFERGMNMDAPK